MFEHAGTVRDIFPGKQTCPKLKVGTHRFGETNNVFEFHGKWFVKGVCIHCRAISALYLGKGPYLPRTTNE